MGETTEVGRGGFDGVLVTFGDGCDIDTWESIFGAIARGYTVRLTTRAGEVEGECRSVSEEESFVALYRSDDDERVEIPISDVLAIHIY
jgi:hypothetical protein